MPRPNLAPRGSLVATRRTSLLALATLATFSILWLLAAASCLARFYSSAAAGPLTAPAAVALLISAAFNVRLCVVSWRRGQLEALARTLFRPAFWLHLTLGALAGYVAALGAGHVAGIGWAWLASVSLWQSLLLLPLAAPPKVVDGWRRWVQDRTPRSLNWLVYAAVLLLLTGEAALRAHRFAAGEGWIDGRPAAGNLAATAGEPAEQAFGIPLARPGAGRLRVAVVGGTGSNGHASGGLTDGVRDAMPGLELSFLATRLDDANLSAARLADEIERSESDLVLAVLPVCQDLAREPVQLGYFDWRQFELALFLAGEQPPEPAAAPPARHRDFEAFLNHLAPQLAACRTPIDDVTHTRWQRTYASLDRVIKGCRQVQVPLALVIVPGEFQVDPALAKTLLRRNGLSTEQFDAELPQRRLAGFAESRGLPTIDLLPHLRLCRQSVYERHTTALNEHGNRAAVSAIGGWLQSRYGQHLTAQLSKAP